MDKRFYDASIGSRQPKKTRRGRMAAGFMSFVAQVGVMVRSQNFVFLIGIIQMKNGMTLASGLLVMSKTRISFAHVAGAAAFAGVISLASVGLLKPIGKSHFQHLQQPSRHPARHRQLRRKEKPERPFSGRKRQSRPGNRFPSPPDI